MIVNIKMKNSKYFCPKCGKEITEEYLMSGICPYCHFPLPSFPFQKEVLPQKNFQENSKENFNEKNTQNEIITENPDLLLGMLSFLVPILGLIMGLVYVTKNRQKDKKTARLCFGFGLLGFIINFWILSILKYLR